MPTGSDVTALVTAALRLGGAVNADDRLAVRREVLGMSMEYARDETKAPFIIAGLAGMAAASVHLLCQETGNTPEGYVQGLGLLQALDEDGPDA